MAVITGHFEIGCAESTWSASRRVCVWVSIHQMLYAVSFAKALTVVYKTECLCLSWHNMYQFHMVEYVIAIMSLISRHYRASSLLSPVCIT